MVSRNVASFPTRVSQETVQRTRTTFKKAQNRVDRCAVVSGGKRIDDRGEQGLLVELKRRRGRK